MSKPNPKKRRTVNPVLGIGTDRPTATQCRQATEILIREHLFVEAEVGAAVGARSRYIRGGPDVLVLTLSGRLIEIVEQCLKAEFGMDFGYSPQDQAIDVKPASDGELQELRRIAGLERK